MEYQILIEQQPQNGFVATVLGWPEFVATGYTKQEAIVNVRSAVEERLARGEVLNMEIETPQPILPVDPWESMAGRFADDPTWDEFEAELKRIREEANRG
ncbi:HicB family protein [Candidatus Entotheonella serta]|nr:HicB family protein [Candidatus Entotheonella serta]